MWPFCDTYPLTIQSGLAGSIAIEQYSTRRCIRTRTPHFRRDHRRGAFRRQKLHGNNGRILRHQGRKFVLANEAAGSSSGFT